MDPRRFQAPAFGRPMREPGNQWAFWYFLPAPVPRELTLDPATVYALHSDRTSATVRRGAAGTGSRPVG